MMHLLRRGAFAILLIVLLPSAALADLRLASWNIQHLGWNVGKDYPAVARIAAQFDFLAIQEVMNAEGIYRLRDTLEDATGAEWSVLYSDALGRNTYREKYAFLWREAAVEYVGGALTYIDEADRFAREPFSAVFRSRGTDQHFLAATVHITYGDRVADRVEEIEALRRYWDWLADVMPEYAGERILFGDFNLPPHHDGWASMRAVAEPLVTEGATTLSTHDRRYANLYDNLWVPKDHTLPLGDAGILPFPVVLSEVTGVYWDHEKARDRVSDHAPVYVLFEGNTLHDAVVAEIADQEAGCIDLNRASVSELTALPHIGEARAEAIKDGRPWNAVRDLKEIRGIGAGRLEEIKARGEACIEP
ncbi:Endonuclease/exonuclease/phosphatase (plasmid) [Thioalkalivibrio sp. K90mix]|uniref:Deoxyribonuclease n=1 Tax=Thioalkalivibrio sp. (strain K90mix) TaxID=396595 RepID=DNAS1_THISK|nr:deoxyribonuclease [Thioalkalivibrio sp. K90mix]D3SGB1.1 RecName: Full=Deoxyribonuclease; Short=DNase; Flags: Precursor [Thioalkalivibrio sp. K90mix]ADC73152.1 Endonuclease/exonuclease/phosphatase [Thioalkalivibrio sp. K90mix]